MHSKIIQAFLALLFAFHYSCYAQSVASAPASKSVEALKISCVSTKVKSQNKNIILTSNPTQAVSGQFYFLKNVSKKSLWLDHPSKRAAANAGWSSYLRPGQWSVIWLEKKEFALSCAVIAPGQVEYLDCGTAISVCIPRLAGSSTRKGSFWVVEDKSWDDLLKVLEKKGIK